jgi:hypothetical protein
MPFQTWYQELRPSLQAVEFVYLGGKTCQQVSRRLGKPSNDITTWKTGELSLSYQANGRH